MGDWLEHQHQLHTDKVKSWGIEKGDFIQQTWTASGVWYEVKEVGDNYLIVFDGRRSQGTDWVFFYNVRNHTKELNYLEIIHLAEGDFGGRKGKPLRELPEKIKQKILPR